MYSKIIRLTKRILQNNFTFTAIMGIVVATQVSCLCFYMHPWFDEVVFADISKSVSSYGKFTLDILPLSTAGKEVVFFGPVFFYMQAQLIKLVGLTAFSFRLPVYIFGVLSALVLSRIVRIFTGSKLAGRAFILLFLTDFLMAGSLSCGRMDMVALLPVSVSLIAIIYPLEKKANIGITVLSCFISSFLFCLAMLTTPRSMLLYLLLLVPLYRLSKIGVSEKRILIIVIPALHLLISFSIPYIFWYYPRIGSLPDIVRYLSPSARTQLSFGYTEVNINSLAWAAIAVVFIGVAVIKKVRPNAIIIGSLATSLCYISIVIPWSFHHGTIVPVLILIAVTSACSLYKAGIKKLPVFLVATIGLVNLLFTSAKYFIILIDLSSRRTEALDAVIRKYVPEGSKVIGDYAYYYAIQNNHCSFRSIVDNTEIVSGKPVPGEKKVSYLIDTFRGDYIVVREDETATLLPFLAGKKYVQSAKITIPDGRKTWWENHRTDFGLPYISFYNGMIHRRVQD